MEPTRSAAKSVGSAAAPKAEVTEEEPPILTAAEGVLVLTVLPRLLLRMSGGEIGNESIKLVLS